MDIRTKLIFAFVSATLTSMIVLGTLFYNASSQALQSITARQLESLAAARQQDLRIVAQGWFDQVRLISSRTKLRDSLKNYADSPSEELRTTMQKILRDAQSAVDMVTRVALYDADNNLVTSSGDADAPLQQVIQPTRGEVQFGNFHARNDGGLDARILARMELNAEYIGSLEIVANTDSLREIAGNYTGLGSSGEFFLVSETTPGQITVLNPLRHRDTPGLLIFPKSEAPEHVLAALDAVEAVFRDATDYRGTRVWAATRYVPAVSAGLIVKMDEEVELARVRELRTELIDVALALAAFAVLGGALMGIHLSTPLRKVAAVVDRIRQGDREARVEISGEDEVSFLAQSFNELMDDLQSELADKNDD